MKYLLTTTLFMVGCATAPKSEFIKVDAVNCIEVKKLFSEKQLSELNKEEKYVIDTGSVECGTTFQDIRVRKDRIRSFYPSFGVELWTTDIKYDSDLEGPLHITKYNVEHCVVFFGGPDTVKPSEQPISDTCNQLEEKLK